MAWPQTRDIIQTICWLSIIFLLGLGKSAGLGISDNIMHSGITVAHLLAVGMAYIIYAFWKRYI